MDTFFARWETLPAELRDNIYEFVFITARSKVHITSNYRPPALLQLDRTSRDLFARSYYRKTTFVLQDPGSWTRLVQWLQSLERSHQSMLQDILIQTCTEINSSYFRHCKSMKRDGSDRGIVDGDKRKLWAFYFNRADDNLIVEDTLRLEQHFLSKTTGERVVLKSGASGDESSTEAKMKPFVINVTGQAEIPHEAERALINVVVASSGNNKAAVSEEVLTTARHVETILKDLAPSDDSAEAKQASPLAHWSKTSFSATSHVPWNHKDSVAMPRQYKGSINFDIRFKDSKALGNFGARLSSLTHVEVTNIRWILTKVTEKSYRSRLRKEAAKDALQKAQDYCEVMNCTNVQPVELDEGYSSTYAAMGQERMAQQQQAQMQVQWQQQGHLRSFDNDDLQPTGFASDTRDESPLEFRPEEVKMSMSVTVKFHAEYVVEGLPPCLMLDADAIDSQVADTAS
ncbi:hypothetical protein LTR37_021380 [Vermiconidia calcicola]|uniref:Uncharacterized protein n=1 Tax=Vermiconidia calcicola TaxID=1690605 RepID=A0ACC3M8X0_9PEZI|nr:hypothetical protein LTR37_021380 [Vermiconidia calcicola]